MVLRNPKQSYKAWLLDYDALLAASEDECSYCLTEREVQMLLAFVEYIAWKTRYINTETVIDTDLIRHWSANLAEKLMNGCCDDNKIFRFTADGTLQSSTDGGVTWQDDPQEDPRLTAPEMPPLPGADGDAKRCQAANNITAHIKEIADKLISDAGAWSGISTLLAICLEILIFIGIIGSGGLLSPLLLGLAGALLFAGSAAFAAAMTPAVWDQFNCIVYCNLNDDGTCTQAQLSQMIAQAASEFAGVAHEFLARNLILIGLDGVINMGRTMSDRDFDCATCICPEPCPFQTYEGHNDTLWTLPAAALHPEIYNTTLELVISGGSPCFYAGGGNVLAGVVHLDPPCFVSTVSLYNLGSGNLNVLVGHKTGGVWLSETRAIPGSWPAGVPQTFVINAACTDIQFQRTGAAGQNNITLIDVT